MSLLQDNLKEKKEEFTLTESALRDAEDALAVALAQEEEQRAHSLTCSKELAVMKMAVEFHAQGQCEQGKKQQDQETRIADAKRKTEHLQEQLTQSEQEATQFENKLQLAITVSRERKEALFKARRQHQDLCVQLKELMSRRKLLERMQQAYEGFGMAVRSVLRNEEPWHEGICGAVAELLEVPGEICDSDRGGARWKPAACGHRRYRNGQGGHSISEAPTPRQSHFPAVDFARRATACGCVFSSGEEGRAWFCQQPHPHRREVSSRCRVLARTNAGGRYA